MWLDLGDGESNRKKRAGWNDVWGLKSTGFVDQLDMEEAKWIASFMTGVTPLPGLHT